MVDIIEILVHWHAGRNNTEIAASLNVDRKTVRKYVVAAEAAGMVPGGPPPAEAEWDAKVREWFPELADTRLRQVTWPAIEPHHEFIRGQLKAGVTVTTIHQRLRDEHGLAASYPTFYRYCRSRWPERMRSAPRVTVRLDDPPAGEEAQVDFFYAGRWFDPEAGRTRKLYAFLMTLSHSRHAFLYPVLAEDAASWLDGHVAAFAFFGAAPRRLVPDNLSAGILKADRYDRGSTAPTAS